MRAIALLILAALSWSPVVRAACATRQVYDGQFRSTALDVFVRGDFVWVADSRGVRLYDATAAPLRLVRVRPVPGATSQVVADDDRAFVASGTSIVVLSNPGLEIRGEVDLESTIFDLLLDAPYLYVATSAGVLQLDLFDPDHPAVARELPTSTGRAFSIVRFGSFLYAADGDSSIEVFSLQFPSLPQNVGSVATLQGTIAVKTDGVRLFASDGRGTEVFAGSGASIVRVGSLPGVGASSLATLNPGIVFVAGQGSTIRAVDVTSLSVPVLVFEERLRPSGGTSNRIEAIAAANGRIYVAAGDIGLVTYDASSFLPAFPIRSHLVGSHDSIATDGARVWAAPSGGGITQYSVSENGTLAAERSWKGEVITTVHGESEGSLLVSTGATLERWIVTGSEPALASPASLDSPVRSAVLTGFIAFAVTDAGDLWRIDMSAEPGQAQKVAIEGAAHRFVALSGRNLAVTDLDENGTSTFRYFADFDELTEPVTVTIEGAATTGLALGESAGAAVTFKGLSIIDFVTGESDLVAGTNSFAPRAIAIHSGRVLALDSDSLEVRNLESPDQATTFSLPGVPGALAASPQRDGYVAVAGSSGIDSVLLDANGELPSIESVLGESRFHEKVVAADGRVAFFDGDRIDWFRSTSYGLSASPRAIDLPAGTIDVAATPGLVCSLLGDSTVSCLDWNGAPAGEVRIEESIDVVPFSIRSVAGTLWVSVSRDCLSGQCENVTVVVDLAGGAPVKADEIDGVLIDAFVGDSVAWVITDLPREIRRFNVSDPAHPLLVASVASEGNPRSIVRSTVTGRVYTLGSRLIVRDVTTLAKAGEMFEPWSADPSGRVSFIDQRVAILGDCGFVSGRTFDLQLFDIRGPLDWSPVEIEPSSSPGRSTVVESETFYLLTSHSMEAWNEKPPPARRRAVRPASGDR